MSSAALTLSVDQLLRLKTTFEDLSTRLGELSLHPDGQDIALGLNQSVTSLINVGERLQDDLLDPMSQAIDAAIANGENTIEQITARLEGAAVHARAQIEQVVAQLEQMASGREILWFELDVDTSASLTDYTVDFAQAPTEGGNSLYDQGLRLTGQAQADVQAGVSGTIRVGLDLNEATPLDQAVLIDLDDWVIGVTADASIDDVGASFGVLDVAPSTAALQMAILVPLTLELGTDSYIDLGSFNTRSIETLFSLETAEVAGGDEIPDITLTIPFDLRIAGFDEATASLELRVVAQDAFDLDSYTIEWPELHINGEPFDFSRFEDISVDDLATFLNEFERMMPQWFEQMEVPGLGHTMNEVVNFAQKVNAFVDEFRNEDGSWNFNGVQEFIERLEAALTPDRSSVAIEADLRWSETADALEWDVVWSQTYSEDASVSVSDMVPTGILPFEVEAAGEATIQGDFTIEATVGVALTSDANMVTLEGSSELTDLNSGFGLTTRGLLSEHADISFTLANGQTLDIDLNNIVNLGSGATIDDLLAVLNSDDQGEGGTSRITAMLVENRLVIQDNTSGAGTFSVAAPSATITVTPDWAEPGSTEFDYDYTSVSVAPLVLGLWGAMAVVDGEGRQVITGNTLASVSPLDRIYIKETEAGESLVELNAQAQMWVNGGAALGPLSLSLVDGELRSDASWSLDAVDTGVGAADGRLYLSEWLAGDFSDVFEQTFDAPAVDGVWQFQVQPDSLASAFNVDNSLYSIKPVDQHFDDPTFTEDVPYLYITASTDGTLEAGPSEKLSAILNSEFEGFSLEDLPVILNEVFQSLSETAFWDFQLPLINRSVGDILGQLPDLGRFFDGELSSWDVSLSATIGGIDWESLELPDLGVDFNQLSLEFSDLALEWTNDRPATDRSDWDADFLVRLGDWLLNWDLAIGRLGDARQSDGSFPSLDLQALWDWSVDFDSFWQDAPPRVQGYDWDQLTFELPDFGQWFDGQDPSDSSSWGLTGWNQAFSASISEFWPHLNVDLPEFPNLAQTFEQLQWELGRLSLAWEGGETNSWEWTAQFLERMLVWRGNLDGAWTGLQALDMPDLDGFKLFIGQLSDSFAAIPMGLQDFGTWIESLLPRIPGIVIDVGDPTLEWGDTTSLTAPTVMFDLTFAIAEEGDPLQYAYDLSSLNLSSVSAAGVDVLNFTSTGDLALLLNGSLSTRFGIDLQTMQTLFDPADLNAELAMQLQSDDLELGVSLGGLAGVSIGKVSAGDPATITLSSADNVDKPATITYNGASGLSGDASFAAYLPVYVDPSLGSIPVGGLVTIEAAADLTVSGGTVDFEPEFTVDGNFGDLFDVGSLSLSAWIDGAIMFIDGLAYTLESDLISALPFVPNKDFDGPGTFLGEFRDVLEVARDLNSLEGLNNAFGELFDSDSAWTGSLEFVLDGVALAVDTAELTMGLDELLADTQTFVVNFNIDTVELSQIAASSVDLGLDGLGVEFAGNAGIDVALALGLELGLAYDFDTGGFDVVGAAGDEIEAEFALGLQEGSNAKLELGPLQFDLTDARAGSVFNTDTGAIDINASELYASFGMDLGEGALDFTGASSFADNLQLQASVLAALDLDLTSNVGLGVELLAGFYDAGVTPVTFSWDPRGEFSGSFDASKFHFDIENTYISLENLLGDPLLNMLEKVENAFEPLMPVIDMITSEVPLISNLSKQLGNGEVTYLDAISWFGEGAENAVAFVEFLADTVTLADEITSVINTGGGGGTPKLYLGSLSAPSGEDPSALSSPSDLAFGAQDAGSAPADAADAGALDRLNDILAGVGIRVPLLTDPSAQLGQLLFGGEVDLITWDVPDLQASFDFRQSFPVFPPLYVSLFGGVAFETNFDLGYDTRGIRLAMGDGGSAADLLNGVYLVDDNHENYWVAANGETAYSSGIGDAEMGMTAEIGAGAELNVVVAQAGVDGGLRGNLLADLNDPDPDGKVYLDEFASNLMRGPECILDFSGALTVFLEAFIKVGIDTPFGFVTLFKDRFKLAEATILEWGAISCPPVEPTLGQLSDKTLTLNMGDRAQYVLDDGSIEDGDEVFLVDVIRNEDGSVVIGEGAGLVVSAYNFTQDFVGVTRVEFDAGLGNDTVIFTPEVKVAIVGAGGEGNDNLVGGSGSNTLSGDAGDDVLTGRLGDDTLDGGSGDDVIYGFGGRDSISGGAGDDLLYGDDDLGDLDTFAASNPDFNAGSSASDNRDTIDGGTGDDYILSGDDADVVDGGDGDDAILAGDGNDTVEGGRGNDQILGEAGSDVLYGDDEAGLITGGDEATHADKIQGGEGANRIFGGTGNDLIYAADEDQLETATVSGSVLINATAWASQLEGGDGDDTIYATADNDWVKGGDGADFIALGEGDNWAYGGKSSDALIDGSGDSTLLGGSGDDVFDGGEGDDYIEGGIGDDQIFAREGQDTVWGGTTDADILPGVAVGSHFDLIVADGVSDTSQFGFRTTLQADSCAPEIQFAPPVYPEAAGPVTIEVFQDKNWDGARGEGESLIAGQTWEAWVWSLDDDGAFVEQVDYAVGLEDGSIQLANNALTVGQYAVIISSMGSSDWAPTQGTFSYLQTFTIDSLVDEMPTVAFGFGKRADLSGEVTYSTTEAPASGQVVFLDEDQDFQRDDNEQFALTNAAGEYVFEDLMVGQTYEVVLELPEDECVRLSHVGTDNEGYAAVTMTDSGAVAGFELLPILHPVVSGVGLADSSRSWDIDWIPDGLTQTVALVPETGYDQVVVSLCGIDLTEETVQLRQVLLFEGEPTGTAADALAGAIQSINANGDIVLDFSSPLAEGNYTLVVREDIFLNKETRLDGEWNELLGETPADRFVSGDGQAGGTFVFEFNIGSDAPVAPLSGALLMPSAPSDGPVEAVSLVGATSTITGTLWLDSDLDTLAHHRMDSGEPVLGLTEITLATTAGVAIATTTTDAHGRFTFGDVAAGEYLIQASDASIWETTSLTSSVTGQEWLVARYYTNYTVGGASQNNLDIIDRGPYPFPLPDSATEPTALAMRDVAAIGDDIYVSYSWNNAGQPAGSLWLMDGSGVAAPQRVLVGKAGEEYVALDVLDSETLITITSKGDVKTIDTASGDVTGIGLLSGRIGGSLTALAAVGDVAVVSDSVAVAVVRPLNAGSQSPQYLAVFNPQDATLYRDPALLMGRDGADFGNLVGLDWLNGELKALDTYGYAYNIDPLTASVFNKSTESIGLATFGGLSAQNTGNQTTGVIRIDDGQDAVVGVGISADLVTVWEDGNDTIDGGCGDDADVLMGDDSDQLPGVSDGSLVLEGGRDNIRGRGGDDTIEGGLKGDVLAGDEGNDQITGGATGNNRITGGDGNDTLTGGEANDQMLGGAGDDSMSGAGGNDAIYGGAGTDTLAGGDDDDLLVGGDGVDQVSGDAGDDTLVVTMSALGGEFALSSEADAAGTYEGGSGQDQIVLSVPTATTDQTVTLTPSGSDGEITWNGVSGIDYTSIESAYLEGGAGADTIDADGFAGTTFMHGHDGDDSMVGGANDDVMVGGGGADEMYGNKGNDVLRADAGDDTVSGGAGDDTLDGGVGADTLDGGTENDQLQGGDDNDTLTGGAGDDVLDGGAGDDALSGDTGDDTLISAAGANSLDGGADDDTYVVQDGTGLVTLVDSAGKDALDARGLSDDLVLTVAAADGSVTLELADGENWASGTLVVDGATSGDAVEQVILGTGDDVIVGPGAVPPLLLKVSVGDGEDWLDLQANTTGVSVDLQSGLVTGFDVVDGVEHVIGTTSADTLRGTDGDNHFVGIAGADQVYGQGGFDTYSVGYGPSAQAAAGYTLTFNGANLKVEDGAGSVDTVTLTRVEAVWGSSAADRFLVVSDLTAGWQLAGGAPDAQAVVIGVEGVEGVLAQDFSVAADINTLDYSTYANKSLINLTAGTATGTGGVSGFQVVIGSDQTDVIVGTAGSDYLAGGADDDGLFGGDSADYFVGGEGDDLLLGGDGIDTAEYAGREEDYTVTTTTDGLGYVVQGNGERDVLYSIERLVFAGDGDLSQTHAIDSLVESPITSVFVSVGIVGDLRQGNTVEVEFVLVDGIDKNALRFQWLADGTVIDGETQNTLRLEQAQVGKAISAQVTYLDPEAAALADGYGLPELADPSEVSVAEAAGVVVNVNDDPTGKPMIVTKPDFREGGTLVDGSLLTVSVDAIEDLDGISGDFSYQWLAGGVEIEGAQSHTLALSAREIGQEISVTVSYVDDGGASESVSSDPTPKVASQTGEPTGTFTYSAVAEQGGSLKVTVTDLFHVDGVEKVFVTWEVSKDGTRWKPLGDPQAVDEAVQVPVDQDLVGAFLRASVVVIDGKDQAFTVFDEPIKIINVNDDPSGTVSIRGAAQEGETLTVSQNLADADGLGSLTYQWLADGTAIAGATGMTYLVTGEDVGTRISVRVSYVDGFGAEEAVQSSKTLTVVAASDTSDSDPVVEVVKRDFAGGTATTTITESGRRTEQFEATEENGDEPVEFELIEGSKNAGGVIVQAPGRTVMSVSQNAPTTVSDEPVLDDLASGFDRTRFDEGVLRSVEQAVLPNLVRAGGLAVRSIALSESGDPTPPSADNPIVIRAGVATGTRVESEVFVIDTRSLPNGAFLQLDNIEFAAIVGNATITGGAGSNVAVGDAGRQFIRLGADDDTLHGGDGDDTVGSIEGNDLIYGDGGNDTLFDGIGRNILDGGAGNDIATFTGKLADYRIDLGVGVVNVRPLSDAQNVDTLISVEQLQFDDQTIDVAAAVLTLQEGATAVVGQLDDQSPVDGQIDTGVQYTLTTLVSHGTLWLDADHDGVLDAGEALSVQGTFAQTDLDDGWLKYTHDGGESRTDSFAFSAALDALDLTTGTMQIQVSAVNDDPTGAVTIAGQAKQGQTLTASNTLADADGLGEISYRWYANDQLIAGATAATYVLTADEVGKAIKVVASYTDDAGTDESVFSSATSLVEADAELVSIGARSDNANLTIGYTPDGESLVIKLDGVSQIVSLEARLVFSDQTVDASTFGQGLTPLPVFGSVVNGQETYVLPDRFNGPPSLNLDYQLIDDTVNAVVTGSGFNDFIKVANASSQGKAVDAGAGDDVIDGGVGSAFVTGGTGSNTFFLDGRAPGTSWSTITDFKLGTDKATIWGWRDGVSKVAFLDASGGAEGYKGVTLHFENLLPSDAGQGATNASLNSLTFTGKSLSDFGAGSLAELNAQIAAGDNPLFMTGVVEDQYGSHGYLYVA